MQVTDDDDDLAPPVTVSSNEYNAIEIDDNIEEANESSEAELGMFLLLSKEHLPTKFIEKLSKEWVLPIYVFFKPTPSIEYINGGQVHVFKCSAPNFKGKANSRKVHHYLNTTDAITFTNMQKFAGVSSRLLLPMLQRMFMLPGKHWENIKTHLLLQHFSELQKVK